MIMFICNDCLKEKYENHESFYKSFGTCEVCKLPKTCSEIPSSFLKKKEENNYDAEKIAAINFDNAIMDELTANTDYIHVDKDSHFYTDLNQIKQCLELMKKNIQVITFDYIITGINNSLKNHYNIAEYCECGRNSIKGHCNICDNEE